MCKIIVVTPVKNEAWILDRFLSVTSQFADLIIIADQNSTDGSLDIYPLYPKVHLINNDSVSFNEASRQLLLLETARRLVPDNKRIILALDADEILSANSVGSFGWQRMLEAPVGTILYFEKPDLYITPLNALRQENLWPLGYVDDGAEHTPAKIHSIRIPRPPYAADLYLNDIVAMHYSLTRVEAQNAKMQFYSMLENILHQGHFLARRFKYGYNFDSFIKNSKLEKTPPEWFKGWEDLGIDMTTIPRASSFWYDEEALKLFSLYGYRKFWVDNIWERNWPQLAKEMNMLVAINKPPGILRAALAVLDRMYIGWKTLRRLLKKR